MQRDAISALLQEYIGALLSRRGKMLSDADTHRINVVRRAIFVSFDSRGHLKHSYLPFMPRKRPLSLICATCAITTATSKIHNAINVLNDAFK